MERKNNNRKNNNNKKPYVTHITIITGTYKFFEALHNILRKQ
jgi:hypothetical protein